MVRFFVFGVLAALLLVACGTSESTGEGAVSEQSAVVTVFKMPT